MLIFNSYDWILLNAAVIDIFRLENEVWSYVLFHVTYFYAIAPAQGKETWLNELEQLPKDVNESNDSRRQSLQTDKR